MRARRAARTLGLGVLVEEGRVADDPVYGPFQVFCSRAGSSAHRRHGFLTLTSQPTGAAQKTPGLTGQVEGASVVVEHKLRLEHSEPLVILQKGDVRPLALGPLREHVLDRDEHARCGDHRDVGLRRRAVQQLTGQSFGCLFCILLHRGPGREVGISARQTTSQLPGPGEQLSRNGDFGSSTGFAFRDSEGEGLEGGIYPELALIPVFRERLDRDGGVAALSVHLCLQFLKVLHLSIALQVELRERCQRVGGKSTARLRDYTDTACSRPSGVAYRGSSSVSEKLIVSAGGRATRRVCRTGVEETGMSRSGS